VEVRVVDVVVDVGAGVGVGVGVGVAWGSGVDIFAVVVVCVCVVVVGGGEWWVVRVRCRGGGELRGNVRCWMFVEGRKVMMIFEFLVGEN
jgi:hypothetical protein